jgi:hypothetical protein
MAPIALVPPTTPANCVVPAPVLIVKFLVVPSESTAPPNIILEFVVVRVLLAPRVVAL